MWLSISRIEAEEQQKLALVYSIRGSAGEKIAHLGTTSATFRESTAGQFYTQVRSIFQPVEEAGYARSAFIERRQGVNEDALEYLSSKISLFKEGWQDGASFDVLLDNVIRGLANRVVQRRLRLANTKDEAELRKVLLETVALERTCVSEGYGASSNFDGLHSSSARFKEPTMALDAPERMEIDSMGRINKSCHYCKRTGHLEAQCYKKQQKNGSKPKLNRAKKDDRSITCFQCGKKGHRKSECRSKERPKGRVFEVSEAEQEEDELIRLLQNGSINSLGGAGASFPSRRGAGASRRLPQLLD